MCDRVDNKNSRISFLGDVVFQDLQLSFEEPHIYPGLALSRAQ